MDHSCNGQTVLGFKIVDRMAASKGSAGFDNLVISPMKDLLKGGETEFLRNMMSSERPVFPIAYIREGVAAAIWPNQ
jgi:hypothetical protein